MRDVFPEYYKVTKKEEEELWKNCVFIFDSNILINLYSYSEKTRNAFFEVLDKSKYRIWMPNRVAEEYLKNRPATIVRQESPYNNAIEKVQEIKKEINLLRDGLESEYSHPFVNMSLLKKIEGPLDNFLENIKENRDKNLGRVENDEIREKITKLYEGKTGAGFSHEEMEKICAEGKDRYERKVPPGFEDKGKGSGGHVPSDNSWEYGDLIIWKEVIAYSKENSCDIVFVTDDNKEDWWVRKVSKKIEMQPYLKKEFVESTGKNICMYDSDEFMSKANELLKVNVGDDVSREIASVLDSVNKELISKKMMDNYKDDFYNFYEDYVEDSAANRELKTIGDLVRDAREKEMRKKNKNIWGEESKVSIKEKVETLHKEISYLNERLDYIISNEPEDLTASDKEIFANEKKRIRKELMEKKMRLSKVYEDWG